MTRTEAAARATAARLAKGPRPLADRYWDKVDRDGPLLRAILGRCWGWRGAKKEQGYGVLGRGRRDEGVVRATHVSWEIHNGPVPNGMWLLHKCDNPPCSNPAHLFLGTVEQNAADMVAKGRHAHGECSYAKLREADVIEIKRSSLSHGQLAAAFKVSASLIGFIRQGKRWRHVA